MPYNNLTVQVNDSYVSFAIVTLTNRMSTV